jgi:hypothetical protein
MHPDDYVGYRCLVPTAYRRCPGAGGPQCLTSIVRKHTVRGPDHVELFALVLFLDSGNDFNLHRVLNCRDVLYLLVESTMETMFVPVMLAMPTNTNPPVRRG